MSASVANPNLQVGTPPVPRSEKITGITWAPADEVSRLAKGKLRSSSETYDGSDNWPTTWADDDALYTAYGDGYGFDPILPEKLGLGFAQVSGTPPAMTGINIRSDGENSGHGRSGKKASGILMVDGILYLWLFHADENGGGSQLAWSTDYAKSWIFSEWTVDELGLCSFINFGRNYSGARDRYVYTVSPDTPTADAPSDRMILMRTRKDRIVDREGYEFFAGLGVRAERLWTADAYERAAIFDHRDACLRSGISYNAGLDRYLWWQHIPNGPGHADRGDTRFSGGFGIYDAPEPWGPWTTVYFTEEWDMGPGERGEFPTKWMSPDGLTVYLVFSGQDTFSVRRASLEVAVPV